MCLDLPKKLGFDLISHDFRSFLAQRPNFQEYPRMSMATAHSFDWEWVGGCLKLADSEPISLLKDDIIASETYKRMKNERMALESQHERKVKKQEREQEWQKLLKFLEKHNFEDVNATSSVSKSCFGLRTSYQRPLHKAVKDERFEIIGLLLKFGADPNLKDGMGKIAYDYAQSQALRTHMKRMQENQQRWRLPATALVLPRSA